MCYNKLIYLDHVGIIASQPSQPEVAVWDGSITGTANVDRSFAKYDAMVEANRQAVVNIFRGSGGRGSGGRGSGDKGGGGRGSGGRGCGG